MKKPPVRLQVYKQGRHTEGEGHLAGWGETRDPERRSLHMLRLESSESVAPTSAWSSGQPPTTPGSREREWNKDRLGEHDP